MSPDRDTPVVLSKIYTRTGDDGTTALGDMSRAQRPIPGSAAYADTDEANSAIGVAVTVGELPADISQVLLRIQNELFDVGADLCNPVTENPAYPPLRVDESYITALEQACDNFNEGLPVLAQLRAARWQPGRGRLAACGQDSRAAGRAEHLGRAGGPRRQHEPADRAST